MIARYKENPIIAPADVKPSREGYRVLGAFNPAAVQYGDEILLLLRVAEGCESREGYVCVPTYRFDEGGSYPDLLAFPLGDPDLAFKDTRGIVYRGKDYLSTISHIRLARSVDGIHFTIDERPFLYPVDEREEYGVEDARVVCIEGRYYINYTAVSRDSWATALAVTNDFRSVERLGLIFHPENKDVAIFPERIGGKYYALHRPNNSGFGRASIWIAESPDLIHWGNHRCLIRPRETPWESIKIGGGAPPVRTDEGWLIIYHGKGEHGYALFGLLLDLEEPWRVIRRGDVPILIPEEPYEREGFFGHVVFSNGVVEREGKLYIYYGASDETTCLAIAEIDEVLASL